MMKSITILAVLATIVAMASAFSIVGQPSRMTTSLDASRARDKVASRTKWNEKRGFGDEKSSDAADEEEAEATEEDEETEDAAAEEETEEPAKEEEKTE
mmetsp:Transcript_10888/g.30070  ORF Transcript_10888/g.30070 Transcript_10888/m.30070 type:complete len:99 (-) Transcript_10888:1395-1691(-)|eukprot:CAMPEP_0198110432 /NCGR_PEP_ID=MMETSP1442-20131203/2452_1 /TAXON_ID= /ORGANISM="Craspedostauros australis, Strain CCMP3328" /LENGTH=98 /DNA_ID=CAMNT_0043766499 /DNA_START=141 /DNA_END=437 /DNA_ORIENTATION=+